MHPVVRAAAAVAVLSCLSAAPGFETRSRSVTIVRTAPPPEDHVLSAICPKGSLPDATACVPFPTATPKHAGPGMRKEVHAHQDRSGQWRIYEHIPRRPDRAASYATYRYPVDTPPTGPILLRSYDPARPEPDQRSLHGFAGAGHGGIEIGQERGTAVRAIDLAHQKGDADVVFVGDLLGNTVVTRHSLAEAGRTREYLLLHGRLDTIAPNLGPGAVAPEGTLLGTVGDSGREGNVHLYLEARQVRDGVEPSVLRSSKLISSTVSIACDPRNVLPSRRPPEAGGGDASTGP